MSFARWWTELVADIADHVPGGVSGLTVLVLLLAGVVVGALYWRPRRRRIVADATASESMPEPAPITDGDDELPELASTELRSLADRYAAAGRYAEAVRERLRAMVRELVDHAVITHRPGWTATELAAAAGAAEPTLSGPMSEAAGVFSHIWYGRRPATAADDARMRELTTAVQRAIGVAPVGTSSGGASW